MIKDKNYQTSFDAALKRVYEGTGISTPTDLVKILGVSRQAFYKAKSKGFMPESWAKKIRDVYGLSPKWILDGVGPQRLADYHKNTADALYVMRDTIRALAMDFSSRYGSRAKQTTLALQIVNLVDSLRSELDESAFVECSDIANEDRLKLYYQSRGQSESLPSPSQTADETERRITGIGCELAEIRAEFTAAGFSEEEIRAHLDRWLASRTALESLPPAKATGDAPLAKADKTVGPRRTAHGQGKG